MQDVLDQINVLFAEKFGQDLLENFDDDAALFQVGADPDAMKQVLDGRLDSLDRYEVCLMLEDHFEGITIEDDEMADLSTRRQMAELVLSKLGIL